MRKNGFSYPLSFFQILSWTGTVILSFSYYFLYILWSQSMFMSLLSLPYTFFLFFAVFYGLRCTVCDPFDDLSVKTRKIDRKLSKTCTICQTTVSSSTKHCSICNKCISGFDHHCKTLNNCIGVKNYKDFFRLMISVEALLSLQISTGVYTLSFYFRQPNTVVICTVLVTELGVIFVLIIANGMLIVFHLWLKKNKISTYDYIKRRKFNLNSIVPENSANNNQYIVYSPTVRELNARSGLGKLNNINSLKYIL